MYPVHLEIESSSYCNLKCIMCPHKDMRRPQGNMSMETLRKIIDESKGRAKSCFLHMIGEPLMNPNLDKMIWYTSLAGIRTSISTNGMLLDKEWTKKLLCCGLEEITLCLDGTHEETYLKYRIGGDWEKVNKNFDYFLERHQKVNSKMNVIVQLIQMEASANGFIPTEGYKNVKFYLKSFSTFAGYVKDIPGDTPPRRFTCSYPWNHVAIHWNGDICLCCRDFEGFTKMGNVNSRSIEEVFNSMRYEKYRKEFKEKKWENVLCRNC